MEFVLSSLIKYIEESFFFPSKLTQAKITLAHKKPERSQKTITYLLVLYEVKTGKDNS